MKTTTIKPTIAFVSDAIYPYNKGGKEKRLHEISTRLVRLGYDVHIYCMKWPSFAKASAGKSFIDEKHIIENGVHLHAICKYYPLYFGERRSIKEAIFFGIACLKLIKQDFDVIDVDHMPFFPLFSIKLVCLLKGKKMFATWHEVWGKEYWMKYLGILGMFGYAVEKIAMYLPDTIISISDLTTGRLRQELGENKEIHTIGIGIDYDHIRQVKPSAEKSDVIFVGRLLRHKNVDVLIKAIGILKQKFPDIRCLIVGDGPEHSHLLNLIRSLHLDNNIILKGIIDNYDDVYALMKSSKVFVLPSDREGFGIVVIEANACGIPVITSDSVNNSAKELVKNGNGLVVSISPENLAEAIRKILISKTQQNIKNVFSSEKYSWNSEISRIIKTYAI